MGLFFLSAVAFFCCWLWLLVRSFATGGVLSGVLCFIFWPLHIINVVQGWNDPQRDIARPFFATLIAFVAFYTFGFRTANAVFAEAERLQATENAGLSALMDGDDPIGDQIRFAQATALVAFQRGEVSVHAANASIDVPAHFRFAPKPGIAAMAAQVGGEVSDDLVGWIVHESVDLAREDAWVVSVLYEPLGHVAKTDFEDLTDPDVAKRTFDYTERNGGGDFHFASFAHAPQWRDDLVAMTWGENIRWSDDTETVDCHAVKPTREGVLHFVVEDLERERAELCMRVVRLMAAKTRFREGHAYDDYSFFGDARSGREMVDLVTGEAYE